MCHSLSLNQSSSRKQHENPEWIAFLIYISSVNDTSADVGCVLLTCRPSDSRAKNIKQYERNMLHREKILKKGYLSKLETTISFSFHLTLYKLLSLFSLYRFLAKTAELSSGICEGLDPPTYPCEFHGVLHFFFFCYMP